MRIAIYHNLPSGGGKRALLEMTKGLAKRYEIDVYTLSCAEHEFCDLRPYCNQHVVFPFSPLPLVHRPFGRLNQGIRVLDLFRLNILQRQIANQIDSRNYSVVFVHHCQYGQSPGLLRFLQTPSVYYCQEPPRKIYEPQFDRPYARYSQAQRWGNLFDPLPSLYLYTVKKLDYQNVRAAGQVLVNSAYSRESLYRTYGLFARICYLGVDTDRFYPIKTQKENHVLSVGALSPRKGFDFLIEGLSKLDHSCRPRLILVSNHTEMCEQNYLNGLAKRHQVTIDFLSTISDNQLLQLYNQTLATVYAPVMEPFGFVPLESMACGTPVVGVNEAGVRESVTDGVTGFLTERDPEMWACSLNKLLSDPVLANEFGQNGLRQVKTSWTWAASLIQLERELQAAANSTSVTERTSNA